MSVLNYLMEELNLEPTEDVASADTTMDATKKAKLVNALNKFKSGITKDSVPNLIKKIEMGIPKMSPALREPAKEILGLVGMINDWVTGQYTELPWETILTLIAAITYVVSPVDIIPDVIPVAGVVDDVFLVTQVLPAISKDVEKYKEWKSQQV